MKKFFMLIVIVLLSILTSGMLFAQEATQPVEDKASPAAEGVEVEVKEMTKEEILERLNTIFKYRLDIRAAVEGIAVEQDGTSDYYTFNGVRLEDLDKDTLFGVLKLVNQQIALKNIRNLQKTQKQLKQIKNLHQLDQNKRMIQRYETPSAPKVYTPPKTQKPYK